MECQCHVIDVKSFMKVWGHLFQILATSLSIICDYPQGYILEPFLFLIYVNDFDKGSSIFKPVIIVDHTNFFYKTINKLFNDMSVEL